MVSLAAGEVVLRALVTMPLRRPLPEVRYAPHPIRRFTLIPDQRAFSYGAEVTIGPDGFRVHRGGAHGGGPDTTILALGDSFTFGLGVRDDETWPAQLEMTLRVPPRAYIRVLNAGTISYGVFQELSLLRDRGLTSNPRVVIHGLYWNDFMNATAPPRGSRPVVNGTGYLAWDDLADERNDFAHFASRAMSSSALIFASKKLAESLRTRGDPTSAYGTAYQRLISSGLKPEDWQTIEQFYRDLQGLGTEHHFVPMVVILPVFDLVGQPSAASHPYPVAARRLLERLQIRFVDTFNLMLSPDDRVKYFLPQGSDAHLNAAGYKLVAQAIARRLRSEGDPVSLGPEGSTH